jgi:chemotaxis protein CheD
MRAPRLGVAAVTHCLLPGAPGRLTRAESLKYVDATIGILFETFASRGALLQELEVKLIGGADNLLSDGAPGRYSVGSRNVEMALKGMAERGVTPAATIVGGRSGRVLVYDTVTGEVFIKRLLPSASRFREDLG